MSEFIASILPTYTAMRTFGPQEYPCYQPFAPFTGLRPDKGPRLICSFSASQLRLLAKTRSSICHALQRDSISWQSCLANCWSSIVENLTSNIAFCSEWRLFKLPDDKDTHPRSGA